MCLLELEALSQPGGALQGARVMDYGAGEAGGSVVWEAALSPGTVLHALTRRCSCAGRVWRAGTRGPQAGGVQCSGDRRGPAGSEWRARACVHVCVCIMRGAKAAPHASPPSRLLLLCAAGAALGPRAAAHCYWQQPLAAVTTSGSGTPPREPHSPPPLPPARPGAFGAAQRGAQWHTRRRLPGAAVWRRHGCGGARSAGARARPGRSLYVACITLPTTLVCPARTCVLLLCCQLRLAPRPPSFMPSPSPLAVPLLPCTQAGLPSAFNVVCANILRGPLLELAPRLSAYAQQPGSTLILSGLLEEQV